MLVVDVKFPIVIVFSYLQSIEQGLSVVVVRHELKCLKYTMICEKEIFIYRKKESTFCAF